MKKFNQYLIVMLLTLGACLPAYASEVGALTVVLQGLVNILTGFVAQVICIIILGCVGFAWTAGRLSLKQAAAIVIGVSFIFLSPEIACLLGAC